MYNIDIISQTKLDHLDIINELIDHLNDLISCLNHTMIFTIHFQPCRQKNNLLYNIFHHVLIWVISLFN